MISHLKSFFKSLDPDPENPWIRIRNTVWPGIIVFAFLVIEPAVPIGVLSNWPEKKICIVKKGIPMSSLIELTFYLECWNMDDSALSADWWTICICMIHTNLLQYSISQNCWQALWCRFNHGFRQLGTKSAQLRRQWGTILYTTVHFLCVRLFWLIFKPFRYLLFLLLYRTPRMDNKI